MIIQSVYTVYNCIHFIYAAGHHVIGILHNSIVNYLDVSSSPESRVMVA
jgi:hypothetical protein